MTLRHFLRMTLWARRPPSERRARLVLGVIALCALLFAVERLLGWPEWLTPETTPKGRISR